MINPHAAASSGDVITLRLYLEQGGNANLPDADLFTPLHWASNTGSYDICKLLLNTPHIEIDARSKFQSTSLHFAAENGHVDLIRLLIDSGARVDARNSDQATPLHFAAQKGHVDAVLALLDANAHIDVRSNKGNTPLHYAAFLGRAAVVRVLLKRGADSTLRNANGKVAGEEFFRTVPETRREQIKDFLRGLRPTSPMAASASLRPVPPPLEDEERAELMELRETVARLQRLLQHRDDELEALRGQLKALTFSVSEDAAAAAAAAEPQAGTVT